MGSHSQCVQHCQLLLLPLCTNRFHCSLPRQEWSWRAFRSNYGNRQKLTIDRVAMSKEQEAESSWVNLQWALCQIQDLSGSMLPVSPESPTGLHHRCLYRLEGEPSPCCHSA